MQNRAFATYRIKKLLSGTAMAVLGRKHTVRLARFLLNEARYDLPNDMAVNGEPELQRWVVRAAGPARLVVLDVGANIGDWSASMLRVARAEGRSDLTPHAFEPALSTANMLRARLGRENVGASVSVSVHEAAVADHDGEDVLFVPEPGAGTSSLTRDTAHGAANATEARVRLVALDTFAREHGLDHITLCKTDIEGHDISALLGAPSCYANNAWGRGSSSTTGAGSRRGTSCAMSSR